MSGNLDGKDNHPAGTPTGYELLLSLIDLILIN
jgi:hypothetical protein